MKIGIMTWYQYYNYGTVLQAYAMQEFLKNKGHKVEIIKYRTNVNNRSPKLLIKDALYFILKFKYCNIVRMKSKKAFDRFIDQDFSFSSSCESYDDLYNNSVKYDYIICGSDQIWSPMSFDPRYYLDFAADCKKISYAPSFGVQEIREHEDQIKDLVSKFKHLSIREESGRKILNSFGLEAEVMPDPTMLLTANDWVEKSSEKRKCECEKGYLLSYFLSYNHEYRNATKRIAEQKGLKIKWIPTTGSDLFERGCIKESVEPLQFVELIQNASFICTDSFHGTLFSIVLNKQFLTFERFSQNDRANQNTRIYNLLEKFGLMDHIYNATTKEVDNMINYQSINQLINEERKRAEMYLYSSIQN